MSKKRKLYLGCRGFDNGVPCNKSREFDNPIQSNKPDKKNSFSSRNSDDPIQSNEGQKEQEVVLYPPTPADSPEEVNHDGKTADVFSILKDDEVFRGIKVRLYPTKEQKKLLIDTFGCSRFVYNKLLEEKRAVYQRFKDNKVALLNYPYKTPAGLKIDFPFLKGVDSSALANAHMNLKTAFTNYYKHRARHPRFKSKRYHQSYSTSNTNDNCKIDFSKRVLKLPKIKTWIRYRDKRKFSEKIKKITVSKSRSGKFYASMLIVVKNDVAVKNVINRERIVGFDMSAKDFLITKEFRLSNPRFYRNEETKLKRLHRELSRKKKGSANRYRARVKLSRTNDNIANRKRDWTHKVTHLLSKHFDCVILEDLNILGMQRFSSGLSKTVTLDFSWNQFITILKYKMEEKGGCLEKVDRFFPSSKLCSKCGYKNKELELSDREWKCPNCDTLLDRDFNASVNIEEEGLRILGDRNFKIIDNDYAGGLTVKAFGEDVRQTFGL